MSRYVDIEPLINQTEFEMTHDKEANSIVKTCTLAMLYVLKDIPVADVAPVVRCKDCKYLFKKKSRNEYINICEKFSEAFFNCREENDYCSYGVRKDSEQE